MALASRYMTTKQVADYLGMSIDWVYKASRRGDGPPFRRRGAKLLWLRVDVERWDAQSVLPRINGESVQTKPRKRKQHASLTDLVA
jgi:predicted DNA-binding transcriptional regulator AlpA